MKVPSPKKFTIQGDSSFSDRQKTLFDRLSQAEKDCNKDQTTTINYADYNSKKSNSSFFGQRQQNKTKQFRGKESIFKKPELPSPFGQNKAIPDYHKNPHKWTKYTLDDVQSADMSDKTNTSAALSFLKELKARKSKNYANNDIEMNTDDSCKNDLTQPGSSNNSDSIESTTIVFKKPSQKCKEQKPYVIVDDTKSPMFRGSKVILPEYVVGEKPISKSKKEKKTFTKVDRSKQMKLDHLSILEEDDNSS